MKSLVVYDSVFGNTQKIAKAIADELGSILVNVNKLPRIDYGPIDLIIIGSPTHGGRPTDEIQKYIESKVDIRGKKFATFDTRSHMKWVKIFGFASDFMATRLRDKGGDFLGESVGFFVDKKQGPLIDSETKRAQSWAKHLAKY